MRIGLISGEFPPMEGGVGAFTQQLAQAIAASGHEVHVITHREARPEPASGRRYTLGELREPVDLQYATLHPIGRRWSFGDVGRIAEVALRYDLQVLNLQFQAAAYNMRIPAVYVAPWRLKGLATTVVTFHDLRVPYLFPKAGRLRRFVVHYMARQAAGVIATNTADYHELQGVRGGKQGLEQIPIGSNIHAHEVNEADLRRARRTMGVTPEEFVLGYFGFLHPGKGADLLLEALARLDPSVHLAFIGGRTGSSDAATNRAFLQEIEALIGELDLQERVHWTGFLPDATVSARLQAADLMVLPYRGGVSLRRGTLMASLAHGRPIVSTEPAVPVAELQHGENVWLVPAGDIVALAQAIGYLLQRPELRARLSQGAEEAARHFTWEAIAERTVRFFSHLGAG